MEKILIGLIFLLAGCGYGVNKKTTEIGILNTTCVTDGAWDDILRTYTTKNIQDSLFLAKIEEIERMPFPTQILYFFDGPRELIAVSEDHYAVRYVYNPDLSLVPLCGMDKGLSIEEKKRVTKRVQDIIIQYQCEAGQERSREIIETQW